MHYENESPGKALEQRDHSDNNHSKGNPHITSIIYKLSFVLSLVILIGMGWYAWSSFERFDEFERQKDEMAELCGTIIHFDEVLTMSTHMAASSGNLIWEKRYLKYESQLDEAIQRLKIISQDTINYKFAENTDIANVELVALEKKGFNLVHQGNFQAASDLLNSQKYKDLKLSYKEGMSQLAGALKSSAKETHDKLHSRTIIAVLLTGTVVLMLLLSWISLIRINRKNIRHEELEQFSSEPGKNKFFNRAAIICLIGAIFVAFSGLLGWIPSLEFLGNISPHFIPMAPTASICFILLGLIVLIQIRYPLRGRSKFSAVVVTLFLTVFGIMELAEQFHTGIDIEDFLIPDAGMLGLMRKARMSPATGATFFLGGVTILLMLLRETKQKYVKRICSCAGIVGSFVTISGVAFLMCYLYGNPLLYGGATIPMAATTAIGFIFLGIGLVAAAGPGQMPIRLLVGYSSRAKLLRVFLPLCILIILSQDILHRTVFTSHLINSALISVLLLMLFVMITGIIVTVMAGVIGRALDTAEKKRKEAEKAQNTLLDNLPCTAMILKKGTREIVASNKTARMVGAVPGQTCFKKCAMREDSCPFCLAPKLWTTGQSQKLEVEYRGKWYEAVWEPLSEDLYVHYIFDITERKEAEEEIRMNKVYVDTMGDALVVLDTQRNILKVNNAAEELWGYTTEEMLTISFEDIFPEKEHEKHYLLMQKAMKEKETMGFETVILTKDGKEISTLVSGTAISDDKGELVGLVGVFKDITDRKNIENELKKAKGNVEQVNIHLKSAIGRSNQMAQEATVANQAKSDFLANMSHEIRTPMNAIIGFSDLLAQEELTLVQMDYVNTVQNSGNNLLTIINDILDFSKIEAGKLDTEIIQCSLEKLLGNVSFTLRLKATEKGLDFKVLHKTELPANICTDPTRVYQCLTNLINNAIKFTENGHVHVIVSLEDIEDKPFVRFDIEDTGIGIPADKQQAIFKSFSQADSSTTRKYGGTGLGLTITRQLAEILGGSVTVQSEPDKGSTFSLFIPAGLDVETQPLLGQAKMKEYAQESPQPIQEKYTGNILVAEDNPSNQKLIEILLTKMGLGVTLVGNGKQAVDRVTSQSFDLILMDMQMPVMNGYEATEDLRKKGMTIPIVALTANAMKEDEQKCLDAGCDGYLAKPVDRKKLSEVLGKYFCSDSREETGKEVDHMGQEVSQTDNFPIISELADDPDLCEVAEVFVGELPGQLQEIAEAVDHGDLDQLKYLIHTIKGAGGCAGFPVIMAKAAQTEQLVLKGELDSLKTSVDELAQLCQRATADKNASST